MRKRKCCILGVIIFLLFIQKSQEQEYKVSSIACSDGDAFGKGQMLEAKLRKPENFRGYPYFADDRRVLPATDHECQIRLDPEDPSGMTYNLLVTDFKKCGVSKQNSYTTVRIWFPALPGLVLMIDQEVVIMCRPVQQTVTENRAAGIAGSIPLQGRVSGIVEEGTAKPEYGIAVFREATARSGNYVMPVDQAVPIGTRLQLKASVNTNSAWKFAKLMEVSVSTDPNNAYQPGFIFLVQEGCRNPEYGSVVPNQPHRLPEFPGEVSLEFEAFLLETMSPTDVLWIHTRIKACVLAHDCTPTRCTDVSQPVGFGRKRRAVANTSEPFLTSNAQINDLDDKILKNFSQNVGIKIIPPGDVSRDRLPTELVHCNFLLIVTIVLGSLLLSAIVTVILLACRVHTLLKDERKLQDAGGVVMSEWRYTQQHPTRNSRT